MYDKELIGMWRYAISKKLRKRINKAATKAICIRLNEESAKTLTDTICGTHELWKDCPFFVKASKSNVLGYCLAPKRDKEWHEELKIAGHSISPTYEKKKIVVGCYLAIFAEKGFQNYQRLLAWKARLRKWQLTQRSSTMSLKLGFGEDEAQC